MILVSIVLFLPGLPMPLQHILCSIRAMYNVPHALPRYNAPFVWLIHSEFGGNVSHVPDLQFISYHLMHVGP